MTSLMLRFNTNTEYSNTAEVVSGIAVAVSG